MNLKVLNTPWIPQSQWTIVSLPNHGWLATREDGLKIAETSISDLLIIMKNADTIAF